MFESRNESNNEREARTGREKHRDVRPTPPREVSRSLSTEIPHTLTLAKVSLDTLERVVSELMPSLKNLVTGELYDIVNEGRCLKGSEVRLKYFDSLPISLHQSRAFELCCDKDIIEKLHSIKIVDERCQPEFPSLEIFKLDSLGEGVSLRFSFDTLSVSERWELVEQISSLMGAPHPKSLVETLPAEHVFTSASGSSFFPVSSDVALETLSTLSPVSNRGNVGDRSMGPGRWRIESVEYSQPGYSEQSALLQLIDPDEFRVRPQGNLLSSLILHVARAYATEEGEVSLRKLERSCKHIKTPVTVTFERMMTLGDPEHDALVLEEAALMDDDEPEHDLSSDIFAEPYGEESAEELDSPPEHIEHSIESIESDSTSNEGSSPDPCAEDIKDFGTTSRVRIEKRGSAYGQYSICFSSESLSGATDQINDDSFFDQDAPVIKVDFLDAQSYRNRWQLLSRLHEQLADSMQIPDDEAHNLEHLEHDFSYSDVATSGDRVALYLGRVRVIASRL